MRSARNKRLPLLWFIAAALVAVAGGGIAYWIYKSEDPYRTTQKLDAESYLENGNSLRGNTYKIEGVVQNSLAWDQDRTRLFSIRLDRDDSPALLPVIVPKELSGLNFEKGQRIAMKVEVIEGGFIKAIDARKR